MAKSSSCLPSKSETRAGICARYDVEEQTVVQELIATLDRGENGRVKRASG